MEVVGLQVRTPLCSGDDAAAKAAAAERLGIELHTAVLDAAFCQLLRQPRFGRIAGAAPCLDCRIAVFARAREVMVDRDADFVVSGEVVGQRARSAVRELEMVAHHAGLAERLLRPLSAGLLPITLPERRGSVDRSRLLSWQGKGRKEQLRLAAELSIDPIPPPRAQCPLLAEPLAGRVLELLRDEPAITPWDLALAAVGRHVRGTDRARVVLSRNRAEGDELAGLAAANDRATLVQPIEFVGPVALVVGEVDPVGQAEVLRLMARHGRCEGETIRAVATRGGQLLGPWRLDRPAEVP
jgi:hypothetical protein